MQHDDKFLMWRFVSKALHHPHTANYPNLCVAFTAWHALDVFSFIMHVALWCCVQFMVAEKESRGCRERLCVCVVSQRGSYFFCSGNVKQAKNNKPRYLYPMVHNFSFINVISLSLFSPKLLLLCQHRFLFFPNSFFILNLCLLSFIFPPPPSLFVFCLLLRLSPLHLRVSTNPHLPPFNTLSLSILLSPSHSPSLFLFCDLGHWLSKRLHTAGL